MGIAIAFEDLARDSMERLQGSGRGFECEQDGQKWLRKLVKKRVFWMERTFFEAKKRAKWAVLSY
ncbi:MAG: hypothetical protein ABR907_07520 [Terracidiphilus sp.]|jgi:hypothetical protein